MSNKVFFQVLRGMDEVSPKFQIYDDAVAWAERWAKEMPESAVYIMRPMNLVTYTRQIVREGI